MTIKHYDSRILHFAKKLKSINLLGGKCEICGENNFFKLSFHHIDCDDKEFEISTKLNNRWSNIEKELNKCKLLCHNCHHEFHFKEEKNKRNRNNKKIFLEIKNSCGCELCGYNKSNVSLTFHHTKDKYTKFCKFTYELKSIYDVEKEIIDELNTCKVICRNCHQEIHSDVEFFELHKKEIIEKSENLKEIQPKLDRELVRKMYFENNMKQVEISKYFNASKGTICDIIKELKMLV